MINLLRFYADAGEIEIVGVTALELPPFMTLDGYRLIEIGEIQLIDYDYLVVMSDGYLMEIVDMAMSKAGTKRNKIVSYHILTIPYFSFQRYHLIKEQNVSIVSNNCWAGLIYNTLELECISPFKNVSFAADDYIKIICNLKHYLSVDPEWKGKKEIDKNQNREVPMLELDDVYIKCNHDLDANVAIKNWIRRRNKFNWDNILVEMYTEDSRVEKEFGEASKQYSKRICFVPYKSDAIYSVSLPMSCDQSKFWETVNSNAQVGKNAVTYDILRILDGETFYRVI